MSTARITDKQLEQLATRINEITKSPMQAYAQNSEGRHVAQIGNFHISYAYGGVCLHRMHNESGGVTCPIVQHHCTKRELFDRMHAFIDGLEFPRA